MLNAVCACCADEGERRSEESENADSEELNNEKKKRKKEKPDSAWTGRRARATEFPFSALSDLAVTSSRMSVYVC